MEWSNFLEVVLEHAYLYSMGCLYISDSEYFRIMYVHIPESCLSQTHTQTIGTCPYTSHWLLWQPSLRKPGFLLQVRFSRSTHHNFSFFRPSWIDGAIQTNYLYIMTEAPQKSAGPLFSSPQDASGKATGAEGKSFWLRTKEKIVFVLVGLCLLGLVLGLALGLTIGRKSGASCSVNDSSNTQENNSPKEGGQDEYSKHWVKPENLASSPGWYPAPRGGSDPAWTDAYQKAAKLVGQMSLLEKVNVTTGTGWQMGPCVGNTGVTRVGFPSLCLQGRQGSRSE